MKYDKCVYVVFAEVSNIFIWNKLKKLITRAPPQKKEMVMGTFAHV